MRLRGHFLAVLVVTGALGAAPASADLARTFSSYHAFITYGENGQDNWKRDADKMADMFGFAGSSWDVHQYGAAYGSTVVDALADMVTLGGPDELVFFYYSGHGGGYHGGGKPDAGGDESQFEDPLPPGVVSDTIDETLAYAPGQYVLDDEFGLVIEAIQAQCGSVCGVIDACHSNGMLDGADDAGGHVGKESVWMTAATEWEVAYGGDPYSVLTRNLVRTFDPASGYDQLGDFWDWYWDAGELCHYAPQTFGVKIYEEDGSGQKYYFPPIPEPLTALSMFLGLAGLVRYAGKRRTAGRTVN